MNEKKLVANFLLEIAKKSTTEFIEDAEVDEEIIKVAKKLGITIPSPDFALFRTVWAEIDKPNLNGVRLPRKVVEEGLDTFLFKQLNFEHRGAYNMCGITIAVKIVDDRIETINIFYKSLYPDEFEELKEKIKSGEAAVSFEIYNKDPETGESVIKELPDGTKEITKLIVHGTGLLLVSPPACPKAKIFKLIAKKEIEEAEQIVNKVFNEDLIYAQMAVEQPKCINCGSCNCGTKKEERKVELTDLYANVTKEEDITFDIAMMFYYSSEEEKAKLTEDAAKWTLKFINDLPDSAFAVIEPDYPEKTENKNCRHLPHHNGPGDLGGEKSNRNLDLPHYRNALARVNQIKPVTDSVSTEDLRARASAHLERHRDALEKSSEEVKTDETIVVESGINETKTEEKLEVADTKIEEPRVEVTAEANTQEMQTIEPKVIVKVTTETREVKISTYIDGTPSGTEELKGYFKKITEYSDGTKDELEEEVQIERKYSFAELEEAVKAARAEKDVEIATLKTEYEKVLTEKDKEIATIKEELGKKDQEIAELRNPKVEPKKEMTVGAVNIRDIYEIKRKQIDEKAFGKR